MEASGFQKRAAGLPLFEQGDHIEDLLRVRKLPVVVHAKKMDEPFVCRTLEGDLRGDAGDYLMIGVQGEVYPCKADIFDKTYEVLGDELR
jgi:hypothetical protein